MSHIFHYVAHAAIKYINTYPDNDKLGLGLNGAKWEAMKNIIT